MPHVSVDLTKNLLAEETTIDPSNPFPSFLEMKLAQETTEATEKAIRTSIAAGIDHFNRIGIGTVATGSAGSRRSMKQKVAVLLSRALARYRSEVELVVNYFILRRSLLSSASSTLAESLYGLKRSAVLKDDSLVKLEEMDGIRAALLLSFGPYLKLRLDAYYERMRDWYQDQHQNQHQHHHQPADEQSNMNQRPKTMASKLKKLRALFVHLYPFLHMSHNGIQLAYQFAFLIGKTNYFGPSQHFLGQVVRRMTIADGKDAAGRSGGQTQAMKPLSEQIPEAALLRLKKAAVIGVASALLVGWIGKFRQEMRRNRIRWIVNGNGNGRGGGDGEDNGSGEGRERNGMSNATRNSDIVIPPPPLPFLARRFEDSVKPNSDHRLCPLCLQKRVNPAASSSGHVFCYKCLVLYIREKGPKCPLVGMRCDESQIVRLFEPSSHVQSI